MPRKQGGRRGRLLPDLPHRRLLLAADQGLLARQLRPQRPSRRRMRLHHAHLQRRFPGAGALGRRDPPRRHRGQLPPGRRGGDARPLRRRRRPLHGPPLERLGPRPDAQGRMPQRHGWQCARRGEGRHGPGRRHRLLLLHDGEAHAHGARPADGGGQTDGERQVRRPRRLGRLAPRAPQLLHAREGGGLARRMRA